MSRLEEVRDFVRSVDPDLQRSFDFVVDEIRDTGDAKSAYNVRGHAAVFEKWSLDLGGFREKIRKGAFDSVLSRDPHVLHLWDHDSRYVLSSTRNKTLELRIDPMGLHYWSRVAKTSYADDLRILLERGDISQSSFAFTVAKDEWRISEEGGEEVVEREIIEVGDLFDVTTTAMGAYSTTDAAVAVRKRLAVATEAPPQVQKRADMESVLCLTQMYELGQAFMEDEDQPDDASDRAAMQQILDGLEALIEAEASEPNDEGSEMEMNGRPKGATEHRADAGADRGEIVRLQREAEAAALVARERLYRRVS